MLTESNLANLANSQGGLNNALHRIEKVLKQDKHKFPDEVVQLVVMIEELDQAELWCRAVADYIHNTKYSLKDRLKTNEDRSKDLSQTPTAV